MSLSLLVLVPHINGITGSCPVFDFLHYVFEVQYVVVCTKALFFPVQNDIPVCVVYNSLCIHSSFDGHGLFQTFDCSKR